MNARTFLAHGIAVTALAIGAVHSASLTGTGVSAEEKTGGVILADDKWDVVTPTPGSGGGSGGTNSGTSI